MVCGTGESNSKVLFFYGLNSQIMFFCNTEECCIFDKVGRYIFFFSSFFERQSLLSLHLQAGLWVQLVRDEASLCRLIKDG